MNRTLTLFSAFGIVLVSILAAFAVGAGVARFGTAYLPEQNQLLLPYLSIFIGQSFMVVPLIVFLVYRKEPLFQRLRLQLVSSQTIIATVILSLGIVVISDEIDRLTNLIFPQPEYFIKLAEMLNTDSIGSALLLILAIVVIAPLGEEMLFRGFLQKFLEEYWKDITRAILVTSMFFALIHLNPYWVIQIYLLGMILGYLAWRTGSVIPSFILHGINNGLALILNSAPPTLDRLYTWNEHVSPLWLLFAIGFVFVGFKQLHKIVEERV
ncbi:MAG: CPBP family intramembrane metalloprotease [FCB group bacterium]|nr:CPBP family intramembrane metalloprotease [FCB group bacterium]